MAGRRAKPLSLHLYGGNKSHLTKQEIEDRREGEIQLGGYDFKATKRVKANKVAHAKWKEIIGLYTESELDFVSTSDAGLIERYCLTYAEYLSLQDVRDEIVARGWDKVKTYHATDELNLDSNINKKLDQLTRMEDRLYLNPLSKNRNVPKKPAKQPEASPLEKAGFGNV